MLKPKDILALEALGLGGDGGGSAPVLETLTATENRTYTPDAGVDGFDEVVVDVEGGGTISDVIFDNAPKITYNQMTPEEFEYTIALGSGYTYAVAWLVLYDGTTPICIAESVKGTSSNVSTNPNIVAYFEVSSGDVASLICDLSSTTAPSAVIYKGK